VQEKVEVFDPKGNKIAEVDVHEGPYSFQLQTVTGLKNYKLSFIYKRDAEGGKDPTKIKGAMLQ